MIIGKSGVVKADVKVKNAIIGGKLVGNIDATNKIELQTGSHVEGDINTVRLVIDEGVYFEGNCRMGTSNSPSSRPNTSADSNKDKQWSKDNDRKPQPAGSR